MADTKQVMTQALELPVAERARVAERLISSLEAEPDPEVELAWQQEIHRRLDEMDRGEVSYVSWEEVRDRLRRRRASA